MTFDFKESMAAVKPKSFGGGSYQPTCNVPIRINEVHVSGKTPNSETDYVDGTLIAPAFGLEEGAEVKVKLKAREVKGEYTPMAIFDLQTGRKKGSGDPMGEHGAFIAEKARMNGNGEIVCEWIKVVEHSKDNAKERLHTGMISVGYLNRPSEGETGYPRQNRDIHFVESAFEITSKQADNGDEVSALDVFKQTAVAYLQDRSEMGGGRAQAVLRLINNDGVGSVENASMSATIGVRWDSEANGLSTPEESVDAWLSDPKNADWVGFIENADEVKKGNGTLEIWPAWRFQTGKMKIADEVSNSDTYKRHTGNIFSAPRLDASNEIVRNDRGYAQEDYALVGEGSHAVVKPQDFDTFFANNSYSLDVYPQKLYPVSELITEHVPEKTKAVFEERAKSRVAAARQIRAEKKAATEAKNDTPAGDAPSGFANEGAPDPTGGLTPR